MILLHFLLNLSNKTLNVSFCISFQNVVYFVRLETLLTTRVIFHGSVKCSEPLANYLALPISPIVLFVDVDKEFSHVKLF
jgi:hypothetical protein